MFDFFTWVQMRLLTEERDELVPQSVLQGYEGEFRKALEQLIQRTVDPVLRQKFEAMIDCPLRDLRGNCRTFSEYILSALVRNGIHRRFDIEATLSHVFQQLMMDRSLTTGQPRVTVFSGFDPNRPYDPDQNPLVARFLMFLKYAIRNVLKGRIPRLSNQESRPHGTVSIGQGRPKEGDFTGEVSPDQIVGRPSTDADMTEIVADISTLLQRKEAAHGLPLTALFKAIMAGQRMAQQVQQFGDRPTKLMRAIIKDTVQEYAHSTGNYRLLYLLKQFEGFRSNAPMSTRRQPVQQAPKTVLPPKERDYRSIAAVIGRFDRPVGSADLGRYRRRWLEYPARTPGSGFRNRLEEVLHQMTQDGVLTANRTSKGAVVYSPGPHFDQYRQATA